MIAFFEGLARDWGGWDGVREFDTVEHDFKLSASHDGRGHVSLLVTLGTFVAPESETWMVRAPIHLEAGALDKVVTAPQPLAGKPQSEAPVE